MGHVCTTGIRKAGHSDPVPRVGREVVPAKHGVCIPGVILISACVGCTVATIFGRWARSPIAIEATEGGAHPQKVSVGKISPVRVLMRGWA